MEVAEFQYICPDPNPKGEDTIMDDSSHVYPVKAIDDTDAWDAIARFKERAGRLIDLQDGLFPENKTGQWARFEHTTPNVASHIPSNGTLKSFYDAFRFCYATQEPSNFQNIKNIIARVTIGEHEQAYLKSIESQWNAAETRMLRESLIDRDLSGKEIMDLWFEEGCDDSDIEEPQRFDTLRNLLRQDASRIFLFQTVLAAGESIRLLYDVVEPLVPENPVVNVPDYFVSYV